MRARRWLRRTRSRSTPPSGMHSIDGPQTAAMNARVSRRPATCPTIFVAMRGRSIGTATGDTNRPTDTCGTHVCTWTGARITTVAGVTTRLGAGRGLRPIPGVGRLTTTGAGAFRRARGSGFRRAAGRLRMCTGPPHPGTSAGARSGGTAVRCSTSLRSTSAPAAAAMVITMSIARGPSCRAIRSPDAEPFGIMRCKGTPSSGRCRDGRWPVPPRQCAPARSPAARRLSIRRDGRLPFGAVPMRPGPRHLAAFPSTGDRPPRHPVWTQERGRGQLAGRSPASVRCHVPPHRRDRAT